MPCGPSLLMRSDIKERARRTSIRSNTSLATCSPLAIIVIFDMAFLSGTVALCMSRSLAGSCDQQEEIVDRKLKRGAVFGKDLRRPEQVSRCLSCFGGADP